MTTLRRRTLMLVMLATTLGVACTNNKIRGGDDEVSSSSSAALPSGFASATNECTDGDFKKKQEPKVAAKKILETDFAEKENQLQALKASILEEGEKLKEDQVHNKALQATLDAMKEAHEDQKNSYEAIAEETRTKNSIYSDAKKLKMRISQELASAKQENVRLTHEISAADSQISELEERIAAQQARLAEKNGEHGELAARDEKFDAETTRSQELNEVLRAKERDLLHITSAIAAVESELDVTTKQVGQLEMELQHLKQRLLARKTTNQQAAQKHEETKAQMNLDIEERRTAISARKEAWGTTEERLLEEMESNKRALTEEAELLRVSQEKKSTADSDLAKLKAEVIKASAKIETFSAQNSDLEKRSKDGTVAAVAKEASIETTVAAIKAFEGSHAELNQETMLHAIQSLKDNMGVIDYGDDHDLANVTVDSATSSSEIEEDPSDNAFGLAVVA